MHRIEYPRPSFIRKEFLNLNGEWRFEFCDAIDSPLSSEYSKVINVPFCMESELSQVGYKDFVNKVGYRRTIQITQSQLQGDIILHFGAVDYKAEVYLNKKLVGTHSGGYASFSFYITDFVNVGENILDVVVTDDHKDFTIPSGKQSCKKDSYFCFYTRTTGIWQTVWLEYLPKTHIKSCKITPSVDDKKVTFAGECKNGGSLGIEILYNGEIVATSQFDIFNEYNVEVSIPGELVLWDVLQGNLYDIKLTLTNGKDIDIVKTYCAFRKIEIKGKSLFLNDKKVKLVQVLDQGLYPDGIYTAPTLQHIYDDIDLAIKFGFNGLRPHQKVFEDAYLTYADKKGVLLLGEFPNWNCNLTEKNPKGVENFTREWQEVLERDYNHPSIIGWCPLNETWWLFNNKCDKASQEKIFSITKEYDSTRFVIGSSGGDSYVGDIFDIHSYNHNGETLKKIIGGKKTYMEIATGLFALNKKHRLTHKNAKHLPLFLSEYGGLTFSEVGKTWGYSKSFNSEEDVVNKFIELTNSAFACDIMGVCYTQLYDVEQEQNGLVKYDRTAKLSDNAVEKIRKCLHAIWCE